MAAAARLSVSSPCTSCSWITGPLVSLCRPSPISYNWRLLPCPRHGLRRSDNSGGTWVIALAEEEGLPPMSDHAFVADALDVLPAQVASLAMGDVRVAIQ